MAQLLSSAVRGRQLKRSTQQSQLLNARRSSFAKRLDHRREILHAATGCDGALESLHRRASSRQTHAPSFALLQRVLEVLSHQPEVEIGRVVLAGHSGQERL